MDEIVAEASASLERLAADYPDIVAAGLATMREAVASTVDGDRQAIQRIDKEAHDINGQAATFGFPLLGTIASSLCRLIAEHPDLAWQNLDLIEAHIDAMAWMVDRKIQGDDDTKGRALVASLEQAFSNALRN